MAEHRPWLAFDVEASGTLPEYALQPWRFKPREGKVEAWLTTAAFAFRQGQEIVAKGKVLPKKAELRSMLRFAIDGGYRIVTWNGCYDIAWLLAYELREEVFAAKWLDGMQLWKHLDISSSFATSDHGYSLKGERGAIAHFAPTMQGYEEDVDYHDPSPAARAKLLAYNKDDNRGTLIAVEAIWDQLDQRRRAAALIEARCLPMIADANLRGMAVDKPTVVAVNKRMNAQAAEMAAALAAHGVTEAIVRSPKQLSALLFDVWKLPDLDGRSTSKDVLCELSPLDERVNQVRKYREALLLKSKFVAGMVNSVMYGKTGQTYPQAKVFGTYTSRLTYSSSQNRKAKSGDDTRKKSSGKNKLPIGFALHQMKRDAQFRAMVKAPEGHRLVEFDAAGQEFRWMAVMSADSTMLGLCEPGEDAHSFMGAQIGGRNYVELRTAVKDGDAKAKKIRQGGKVGNLSLQYRTSPATFRIRSLTDHDMSISLQEAEHICRVYKASYPGVPAYWRRQIERGRMVGYAETLAGRRVAVRGNWNGGQAWGMESTMINYPIQGTGGEQKYLALSVMLNHVEKYDAKFAWDMHDGLYWYVPEAKAEKFAHEMRALLDRLPYRQAWDFIPPIPLPWDCKIGTSWGNLKELEAA